MLIEVKSGKKEKWLLSALGAIGLVSQLGVLGNLPASSLAHKAQAKD